VHEKLEPLPVKLNVASVLFTNPDGPEVIVVAASAAGAATARMPPARSVAIPARRRRA
jgi:hypothetical protein